MSFIDVFSLYNQIFMNPDDQEKTSFITDRGIYCYKDMPFGLKNALATYQSLVNQMFAGQLGKTMEVYIDDMLIKYYESNQHVEHLRLCFNIPNEFGMKLYPSKCNFVVTSGDQITTFLRMPLPKTKGEVQRLTSRIGALNRFISQSTDKCLPFFQLSRGNKKFEWNYECEEAFRSLKKNLTIP